MFVIIGIGLKYWLSGIYNNQMSVHFHNLTISTTLVESHKVVSKGYVNTDNSQMESIGAILTPHITQRSLVYGQVPLPCCCVMIYKLAACLSSDNGVMVYM